MKMRALEFARFANSTNERTRRSIVRRTYRTSDATYDVRTDFYKRAREALKRLRGVDPDLSELQVVASAASEKRRAHYRRVLGGFALWAEQRQLEFFLAPRGAWAEGDIEVPINPELGLIIDGIRHLVKLNFNQSALSEREVAVVHDLMHTVFGRSVPSGTRMSVLDLATGRLYTSDRPSRLASTRLSRQAAAIARLLAEVEAESVR